MKYTTSSMRGLGKVRRGLSEFINVMYMGWSSGISLFVRLVHNYFGLNLTPIIRGVPALVWTFTTMSVAICSFLTVSSIGLFLAPLSVFVVSRLSYNFYQKLRNNYIRAILLAVAGGVGIVAYYSYTKCKNVRLSDAQARVIATFRTVASFLSTGSAVVGLVTDLPARFSTAMKLISSALFGIAGQIRDKVNNNAKSEYNRPLDYVPLTSSEAVAMSASADHVPEGKGEKILNNMMKLISVSDKKDLLGDKKIEFVKGETMPSTIDDDSDVMSLDDKDKEFVDEVITEVSNNVTHEEQAVFSDAFLRTSDKVFKYALVRKRDIVTSFTIIMVAIAIGVVYALIRRNRLAESKDKVAESRGKNKKNRKEFQYHLDKLDKKCDHLTNSEVTKLGERVADLRQYDIDDLDDPDYDVLELYDHYQKYFAKRDIGRKGHKFYKYESVEESQVNPNATLTVNNNALVSVMSGTTKISCATIVRSNNGDGKDRKYVYWLIVPYHSVDRSNACEITLPNKKKLTLTRTDQESILCNESDYKLIVHGKTESTKLICIEIPAQPAYISTESPELVNINDMVIIPRSTNKNISLTNGNVVAIEPELIHYSANTSVGDCGSPVLVHITGSVNRWVLAGFHMLGSKNANAGTIIPSFLWGTR